MRKRLSPVVQARRASSGPLLAEFSLGIKPGSKAHGPAFPDSLREAGKSLETIGS
jgi:hypothetical protein